MTPYTETLRQDAIPIFSQEQDWQWAFNKSRHARPPLCSALAVGSSAVGGPVLKAQLKQPSFMCAEAVFFDLDDTLVLSHAADQRALWAVARLLGSRHPLVNSQAVLDGFLLHFASEPWDPLHQIHVTEWRSQLWNRGLSSVNIDDIDLARDMQTCFDAERLREFQWAEGVELLMAKLQQKNVKVAIITNGHPEVQRSKLKACKAMDLFDVIVVGGEEPNPKPHKDIFLKTCRICGCEPGKTVMVGDSLENDIQGGLNANFLATIWMNLHGFGETKTGPRPHHTVTNVLELHDILNLYGAV